MPTTVAQVPGFLRTSEALVLRCPPDTLIQIHTECPTVDEREHATVLRFYLNPRSDETIVSCNRVVLDQIDLLQPFDDPVVELLGGSISLRVSSSSRIGKRLVPRVRDRTVGQLSSRTRLFIELLL